MLNKLLVLSGAEALLATLSNELPWACPIEDFRQIQESLEGGSYSDTCSLTVPANHADAAYVAAGNYMLFQDADGYWQEYKLNVVERRDGVDGSSITATGEHVFYELLGEWIDDERPTATSAGLAVTQMLSGTRWELGTAADLGSNSARSYKTSVLASLCAIAKQWGGELRYRLSVVGGVIDHRYVDILAQRGSVTGKRFELNKDMVQVKQTINTQNIVSALVGRGKGVEVLGGSTTDDPAYGRRLEFSDVVWTVAGGDPADKPADQNWIGDDATAAAYGPGGRHIFGTVNFTDCVDAEELLQLTYDELQLRKVPQATYDMSVIVLEELTGYAHEAVRLGDTVNVINNSITPAITGTARVIYIDRNLADPRDCNVTLGNYLPSVTSDVTALRQQQSSMLSRQSVWDRATAFGTNPTGGGTLELVLDLLKVQLMATGSHYYTDVNGNSIWETPAGDKAIKIGGGILAIANSKTGGEFNWTNIGTGDGWVANSVLAAVGTFLTLTAGTPGAQRRVMGSSSGSPYDKWYDSNNVLRREGFPEYDIHYSKDGSAAIKFGTTIEDKTITVGAGKNFTDPQDAVDSLPYINHAIIIELFAGTYNQVIDLKKLDGSGTLEIRGHVGDTVNVEAFKIKTNSNLPVRLYNMHVLGATHTAVDIDNSNVDCFTLWSEQTATQYGIWYKQSKGRVMSSVISNKGYTALLVDECSEVFVQSLTGSGNEGTIVAQGAQIYDGGYNTITGAEKPRCEDGGAITPPTGQGYWLAWTPTPIWATATPVIYQAYYRYCEVGSTVMLRLSIIVSDGNGATGLSIPLPITPRSTGGYTMLEGSQQVGGVPTSPMPAITMSENTIHFDNFKTITDGSSGAILVSGFYER